MSNKKWARDLRFRKKLKSIEIPLKLRRLFLISFRDKFIGSQYPLLKRKLTRYGVTLPTKRCLLTGRGRGLVGDFGVTRHKFKAFIEEGFFIGITKSSW